VKRKFTRRKMVVRWKSRRSDFIDPLEQLQGPKKERLSCGQLYFHVIRFHIKADSPTSDTCVRRRGVHLS
jgi:hypothetical protein